MKKYISQCIVGLVFLAVQAAGFADPVAPEMIFVNGGTFWMGSTEATYISSEQAYRAEVTSFYISETEITQEVWTKVMGNNPSSFKGESRPVEMITWIDAVKFCNALSEKEGLDPVYQISGNTAKCDWTANGYRLPTETEWEYAARGGDQKATEQEILSRVYYSGSDKADEVAWYSGNSGKQTKPVKSKEPNELGLYDMSGNVWEWCWDWMGAYPKAETRDNRGAASGNTKVLRGGAWFTPVNLCRVTYRFWNAVTFKANSVGFRIVRNGDVSAL